jgi:hypothetical protein
MNSPILEEPALYAMSPIVGLRSGQEEIRPGAVVYMDKEHYQLIKPYRAWFEPIEDEV